MRPMSIWRWLFDAGLAALESISPGKGIYYGSYTRVSLNLEWNGGKENGMEQ